MDADYIQQINNITKRIDKILSDDYGFKHADRNICGDWYPHPHVYNTYNGKQTPTMCSVRLDNCVRIDIFIGYDDGVIIGNAGDHLFINDTSIPKDAIDDIMFISLIRDGNRC